eukprot:TRINITY_DN33075_c0_g1_i1.p1 TRINITY_DN33075_c0_g1~~TRINITY_DN33075_c0_g1_i1.p1  ORF type:complete len:282 (+),score=62.72 TRINITY_DN33075_c0_g1_i1:85-930(+)
MTEPKVALWLLFAVSMLLVAFSAYLFWQCRRIHEATVSDQAEMHGTGHFCVVVHAYLMPMVVGLTQVVAWVGYTEEWDHKWVVPALFFPSIPLCTMYCMINGQLHQLEHDQSAEREVFRVGDVLKYLSFAGVEQGVKCISGELEDDAGVPPRPRSRRAMDVILAPPVGGIEVVQVMPGGKLLLNHPEQLYRSASPTHRCHIGGPFERVVHHSFMARDTDAGPAAALRDAAPAAPDLGAISAGGVRSIDIAARHRSNDARAPPPPPPGLGAVGGGEMEVVVR